MTPSLPEFRIVKWPFSFQVHVRLSVPRPDPYATIQLTSLHRPSFTTPAMNEADRPLPETSVHSINVQGSFCGSQ